MTRARNDSHSTEFGLWLRERPEIDSSLGFVATNLDYVWENYRTGDWMLIEEKRFGRAPTWSQAKQFRRLDEACRNAPGYHGFHLIVFEHLSPDDGWIRLDDRDVSKEELLAFLRFEDCQ